MAIIAYFGRINNDIKIIVIINIRNQHFSTNSFITTVINSKSSFMNEWNGHRIIIVSSSNQHVSQFVLETTLDFEGFFFTEYSH